MLLANCWTRIRGNAMLSLFRKAVECRRVADVIIHRDECLGPYNEKVEESVNKIDRFPISNCPPLPTLSRESMWALLPSFIFSVA